MARPIKEIARDISRAWPNPTHAGPYLRAMMHLDTLTDLKELKICKAYKINDAEIDFFPSNVKKLQQVECIYETLPGWSKDISEMTSFEQLPVNAQNYVERVEQITGIPITIIGVGPKRKQTIFRQCVG